MSIQKILVADIEATEDTDEFSGTPTAAQVIDTVDLQVDERYGGPRAERQVDRHNVGNYEQINISPRSVLSFGVYATGFGTAGTAALYDVILRACGFARTDNVGPDNNQYDLADSGHESLSLYDFRPDTSLRQLITGARGALSFELPEEGLPMFRVSNMMGSYNRPTAASPPGSIDWSAWEARPVLPNSKANVPTLTLDSYAIQAASVSIDWGQSVNRIDIPNLKSTRITDRAPTGEFTFVAPPTGTKNFYEKAESHLLINKLAFALTIGATAGDIVTITGAEYQIDDINEGEIGEELALVVTGRFIDSPQIVIA